MIGVGPFPVQVVIVFGAVLLAWAATRMIARRLPDASRKAAGGLLLDAVFWGLAAARLGYIVQWRKDYLASPMSMMVIGDGGFSWWVGVLVALALVWWRTREADMLRRPVLAGITIGVLFWFAAGGAVGLMQRSAPPLHDLQLTTLDAQPIGLGSYAGRPVVVNLWATWCPPCRREMPLLEKAQTEFPHIAFVLVNQGESARQVQDFLDSEGLTLGNVLLDPSSQAMRTMGARGLPTTLFFDPQGKLVGTHLGELTMAGLKSTLSRRFAQSPKTSKDRE